MEGQKFLFLDGRESKIALTFEKKKILHTVSGCQLGYLI